MKINSLSMLLLSLLVTASCTQKTVTPQPPVAQTKPMANRYPSAEANMMVKFYNSEPQEIVQLILTQDSATGLTEYLEALTDIYIISDVYLEKFDTLLDQIDQKILPSTPLHKIEPYQKLLAGWAVREHVQEQIISVLNQLVYISTDKENPQKQKALNILNTTLKTFNRIVSNKSFKNPQDVEDQVRKYILQDLLLEITSSFKNTLAKEQNKNGIEYATRMQTFIKVCERGILNEKQLAQSNAKLFAVLKANRNNSILQEKAKWAQDVINDLKLDEQLSTDDDRQPNQVSAMYCPTSDSRGNITGSKFPKGTWALTLDDGPHATHTISILNTAAANNIKVSFFWLSQLTPKYPANVARAIKEGHVTGNHSYSHANLPKLSQAGLDQEITQSTATHTKVYGFKPKYFRCPYGACGPNGSNIRQMIANEGMIHVFWNIDSLDWQDKNPDSILARVQKQFDQLKNRSGGIILFHDIHPQSAATIQKLVPSLINQGVQFKSVDQIVKESNAGAICN